MRKFLRKILSSNIFISFCLTSFLVIITLVMNSFKMKYETNDDFGISLFITNGYDKCLYVSYFITSVLVPIQKVLKYVNVFELSQVIFNFLSLTVIDYVFISKFRLKTGILFSVLLNLLVDYFCFVSMQYTRSTAIIATAGYLLLLWAFSDKIETHQKFIKTKSVIGFLFVLVSSFYRWDSFLSVSGVFIVFCFVLVVIEILKSKKENKKLRYISYIKSVISLLTVFVISLSANGVSNYIKETDDEYVYHKNYQLMRSQCVDNIIAPYNENKDFYNGIGVYSDNDLTNLKSWTGDEMFFNIDRMTCIAEYSEKYSKFAYNLKNAVISFNSRLENMFSSFYNVIMISSVICFAVFSVVIITLRNKIKFIFPVLFTMFWLCYLYWFIAFCDYHNIYLAVLPAIFMIVTSFFGNRYYFISICSISAVICSLAVYLNFTHINFRATYTFIVAGICITLYNFDFKNMRVNIQNMKSVLKNIICFFSSLIFLAVCIITARMFYSVPLIFDSMPLVMEYVESHNENFYLMDSYISSKNYCYPIYKPEISDNSVSTSWTIGSVVAKQNEKKYGINNLYPDLINNDKTFYISTKGNEPYVKNVEEYYNDHYSNGKNNIVIKPVDDVENCIIYSIVTE